MNVQSRTVTGPSPADTVSATLLGPELAVRVEALAAELTPAQRVELADLVMAAEEHGYEAAETEREQIWHLLLQHCPGIAPLLTVLEEHCRGADPGCCEATGTPHARYVGCGRGRDDDD